MTERAPLLQELLAQRILCLDGGMGTAFQALELSAADYGGEPFEGCHEHLMLTRPDVVEAVHRSYLEAGADIIETNTFGSTDIVLGEYPPLGEKARAITLAAARLARRLADEYSTADRPRFAAGSVGPTTKPLSLSADIDFAELSRSYAEQARALIEGGVDYLLLETCQDMLNVKAALVGIGRVERELGRSLPIAVSATIEPGGTTLAGQSADAFAVSLGHLDLLYIGLNCGTGPAFMADHLRALAELARVPVACVPNAGLPDEDGRYGETPARMAAVLGRFIDEGWLNLVGGCCGTTGEHIAAFAELCQDKAPRQPPRYERTLLSGLEVVELSEENRPVLVGERTNALGSRRFRRLIAAGQLEKASEIARKQVRGGAQVIDICLQNPDRDEVEDMRRFLEVVGKKVKVPLMIDSTDPAVIELALQRCPGKAIINSVNLENGRERFAEVVPLAQQYGAALVVGCIDDDPQQGMAITRERKLEVARRSYDILTEDYGVDPGDLVFDPLVLPCATGDEQYRGSAKETVQGLRLIKSAYPQCKTLLGISNVSFGLPPAAREALNSVFLYHCTTAGLDMAIVNAQKLERYARIAERDRVLCEQVLFETTDEAVDALVRRYRQAGDHAPRTARIRNGMSLDDRLSEYVVSGIKEGLIADLERKLGLADPLDVINGPLMQGMARVGKLFHDNKLIVAEVLQSAEVMKVAVRHLEPYMDKAEAAHRGTVVLATVRGDVHDVGKNLVDIVLSNNGYKVVNLGLKVPPQQLIAAIEEHQPDVVGLSGLLVKSAHQMVVTARELRAHGRCPPLLVGGAALTREFTRRRIAPEYGGLVAYARDAMSGLELANRLIEPERRRELEREIGREAAAIDEGQQVARRAPPEPPPAPDAARSVPAMLDVPSPPDFERHVEHGLPLDEIWRYLNPRMLYGKHLGLRGDPAKLFDRGDPTALGLRHMVETLKDECRPEGPEPMVVSAVWQFFAAEGEGDAMRLYAADDDERPRVEWIFPRQPSGERLCLADYVLPPGSGLPDSVCLMAVTAGSGIRERYKRLRDDGEFLRSHTIQALAVETAEAAAEWLHDKLRADWGFADPPETTIVDKFKARYRGRRYSFGFPACPDLNKQDQLFELLRPEDIGVSLTGEHMMDPEASVSAIVLHHPAAKYFSCRADRLG